MDLDRSIAQLKALAHPDRVRLLDLLARPERFPDNLVDTREIGVCVNDLAKAAALPQSTTSGHLGQLQRAGLVEVNKNGQFRYVRASDATLGELAGLIAQLGTEPIGS